MAQQTDYPDPDQLQFYAEDPEPFHSIHELGVERLDSGYLRSVAGEPPDDSVGYLFREAYINAEVEEEVWVRADSDQWDFDFERAWELADDLDVGEDFVCATGFMPETDESMRFEAFWILDRVIIGAPRP